MQEESSDIWRRKKTDFNNKTGESFLSFLKTKHIERLKLQIHFILRTLESEAFQWAGLVQRGAGLRPLHPFKGRDKRILKSFKFPSRGERSYRIVYVDAERRGLKVKGQMAPTGG